MIDEIRLDVADATWTTPVGTPKHAVIYGPRSFPIWQKIDGEWEEQTDLVIDVIDLEAERRKKGA